MDDLRNNFTTGGGKIHPCGYVRVLFGGPKMPMSARRRHAEDVGLAIWHPELARFGKMVGVTAHITEWGHFSIRDARGRFLAHVRNDRAISVDVYPGFIAYNGYVGTTMGEGSGICPRTFQDIVAEWEGLICVAIDKAESGEHPGYIDNSPFTKVTDEFTKHQRVIMLKPMLSHKDGEGEMIYDLAGNRFASVTHYPLRVSKWEPGRGTAVYSRSDEYAISAA
ncbi:MAG TPA: hypothetical protein VFY28_02835 [Candidatus Paceibacterota bacterium]|nr:hypothetical protein [Candidatus Paceibacterota bacterium]